MGDPIAPFPADPALQTPPPGQLLLGTDKRNPVFEVYQDGLKPSARGLFVGNDCVGWFMIAACIRCGCFVLA